MQQKLRVETLDYSGIFLSCYSNNNTSCIHATKDHTLLYLYSGEQIIEDGRQKTIIRPGECAFIRRNHRIMMYKNHTEIEQYKGISLTFRREFYNRLNKDEIPEPVSNPDESVFRIELRPDITSLFQSLTPYFDYQIKPSDVYIEVGFKNLSHFYSAFKRQFGYLPKK